MAERQQDRHARASAEAEDAIVPLARFLESVRYDDLPAETLEHVKQSLLDVIGAMLAGTSAEGCGALADLVKSWGGAPQSGLVGADARVPFPAAVLVNTTMGRALELDDVHEVALLHPTVAVAPVAIAFADWASAPPTPNPQPPTSSTQHPVPAPAHPIGGQELLTAISAAMEVTCRLGLGPEYHVAGPQHQPRGMSFTYQIGTMGAAAVTARLLGLTGDRLLDALGNAYHGAAGNQQGIQEGALIVRVQQGLCAQAGALAALVAAAGITGPHEVLEGHFGYYRVFHRDRFDTGPVLADLGSRFEVDNVSIKPYPCCKITHASIAATLDLVAEHDLRPERVRQLVVHVNSRESWDEVVAPVEQKRQPRSPVEAQFALPYLVASAAVRRRVTLADLAPDSLAAPEVRAFAERVTPVVDPDADVSAGKVLPMPATVDLHLTDGQVLSRTVRYARGHPQNRMTWDEVVEKFESSAAIAARPFDRARLDAIVATVRNLDQLADAADLARLLNRE